MKRKRKRRNRFISEVPKFFSKVPGDIRDFTGIAVSQSRDPKARPVYEVHLGRIEISLKEVLRATGLSGELVKVQVPEEEFVYSGDVLENGVNVLHLNLPAMFRYLDDLQHRARCEEKQWIEQQREKKRRKQSLRRKRWRDRQKAKCIQASKQNTPYKSNNMSSSKDIQGDTILESDPPLSFQV